MSDHHDEHEKDEDLLEDLGYEPRDTEIEHAPQAVTWFFVFAIICVVITWGWMKISADQGTLNRQTVENRRIPEEPNPLLQSNRTAHQDMEELREEERAKTDFYSRDEETGNIRIPVDRAMELIVQEAEEARRAERQAAQEAAQQEQAPPQAEAEGDAGGTEVIDQGAVVE